MLLLGRLTNFASRDLPRKRRAFMLKGTFGGNGAPPGSFPGMMPASSRVAMPMGFSPPREGYSPQSDSLDDADLESLTLEAEREWESIRTAFDAISEHFGPDFQALAQDLAPTIHTPFGPAAQYRTYSIAGIWMNYYMGLIVLYRAHPEMPPVAMMAAGMSTEKTKLYATEIGRIAAGLEEDLETKNEISTLVGAAFIECAFPLFVAGVQVRTGFFSLESLVVAFHPSCPRFPPLHPAPPFPTPGGGKVHVSHRLPYSTSTMSSATGSSAACTASRG